MLVEEDDGLRPVAEGVPASEFTFLWWGTDALASLRDFAPERATGTLQVYFIDSRDRFDVSGVSAWQSTNWPEEGIIYAVPQGSRAGTWFAEAH